VVNLSWETRIAASQTIEAIVKNINELELLKNFFDDDNHDNSNDTLPKTDDLMTKMDDSLSSCLENFNLADLLRSNAMLLSSDTQKYDLKDHQDSNSSTASSTNSSNVVAASTTNSNSSSGIQMSEKLRQQRNLLNLKLGIDVGGAAKLDTSHIFSDYDIISSAAQGAVDLGGTTELVDSSTAANGSGPKRKLAEASIVV
jgi:hypothetical protein